jgi:hypothetical protein
MVKIFSFQLSVSPLFVHSGCLCKEFPAEIANFQKGAAN